MEDSEKATAASKLELKREFGVFAGCSLVAAGMIGSGIFLSPGVVLKNCGNFWVSIAVWIVTGFIALTGALCYLELALLIPKTGGPYHYLTKGLGKLTGYEYMWINQSWKTPLHLTSLHPYTVTPHTPTPQVFEGVDFRVRIFLCFRLHFFLSVTVFN